MKAQIIIDRQFSGPPDTSNGGYACGVMANFIDGAVEVTLRRPPPVDKLLEIEKTRDNEFILYDEKGIIAEATSTKLEIDVPSPPSFEEAHRSTANADQITAIFPILTSPLYCNCFVCGTQREEGDGLRLFPGEVEGKNYVATTWIPDAFFADETGCIKNEIVWAALDCPSGWALLHEKIAEGLLGRLSAQVHNRVRPEDKYVVCAWKIAQEGRKTFCGSALFSEDGHLFAKAKAVWIELKPPK
jgi:hypothetical protein